MTPMLFSKKKKKVTPLHTCSHRQVKVWWETCFIGAEHGQLNSIFILEGSAHTHKGDEMRI